MTFKIVTLFSIFWIMQVVAQIFFKWGSLPNGNWLSGFCLGNFFGLSSIWFLMHIYRDLNPNIVLGIATGGAFLFSQIFLTVIFKSRLTPMQWVGITVIIVGIVLLSGVAAGSKLSDQ